MAEPARQRGGTRSNELRTRADNCAHLGMKEIAADLRQLADVHERMAAALLPDSGISDRDLVSELWGVIDPGSRRDG